MGENKMRIDSVDLFYLAMPQIHDIGDGSQDALLVRVRSGDVVGWGECEASPLVSIANSVCPMSHSACKNVVDTVIGQDFHQPEDIAELSRRVRANGMDIAQTDHTWSGVEIALWDLLGKKRDEPVYRLLGYKEAFPKTPYASVLFGDTPEETHRKACNARENGFRAAKFGWGVFGRTTVKADSEQIAAARKGLGDDGILLVDAGTIWLDNVEEASKRLEALTRHNVVWLEEPFVGEAIHAYKELSNKSPKMALAGGEGASNYYAARHLIDHGGIAFIQIDTGRIGGIGPAKLVADYAVSKNVMFVNHTFTTHLALAASLAPFAGIESANLCEYPAEPSELAKNLTVEKLLPKDGLINLPESPGLGVQANLEELEKYLIDVEIKVAGKTIYSTPVI